MTILIIKIVNNNHVQQFSFNAIQLVNRCQPSSYDFTKLRLIFFTAAIPALNAFAGIDSVYISLSELLVFLNRLDPHKDAHSRIIIFKINFLRIVQHEITHVILRDLANDINISTPEVLNKNNIILSIKESGILAEKEHFGGRINWLESSFIQNLNIGYCEEHLNKIEAGQYEKFDIKKAYVYQYSSDAQTMALLDMSDIET